MYDSHRDIRIGSILHCKKEMVVLTLLRLSQLQLNDIMSLPHWVLISSILRMWVMCIGCLQNHYVSSWVLLSNCVLWQEFDRGWVNNPWWVVTPLPCLVDWWTVIYSTTQSPTTTWRHPTHCPDAYSLKNIGEIQTQCGGDMMSLSCNWDNLKQG